MMSVIGCEWQRNLGCHVGKEAIFLGAMCTNIHADTDHLPANHVTSAVKVDNPMQQIAGTTYALISYVYHTVIAKASVIIH